MTFPKIGNMLECNMDSELFGTFGGNPSLSEIAQFSWELPGYFHGSWGRISQLSSLVFQGSEKDISIYFWVCFGFVWLFGSYLITFMLVFQSSFPHDYSISETNIRGFSIFFNIGTGEHLSEKYLYPLDNPNLFFSLCKKNIFTIACKLSP